MQRYRRKQETDVIAIELTLDIEELTYRKWGGKQRANRGDWLVNNDGDVYTVDAKSFAQSYQQTSLGIYKKTSNVWARQAEQPGTIETKEGGTNYEPGDYLVFNDPDEKDGYAMKPQKFLSLYESME